MTRTVPVAWQPQPFSARVFTAAMVEGVSIADVVVRTPNLPVGFLLHGSVRVNGDLVPKAMWQHVRPKARPNVCVTLHMPVFGGGGDGGGKLATIAAIAIIVIATAVTAGAAAPLLGAAFEAGAFGAQILGAAVSIGGALLLGALVKPPSLGSAGTEQSASEEAGRASLSGNALRRGGPMPRVVGTHRVFPPFIAQPFFEIDGYQEFVTAVYGLAGPHQLEDVQAGGVPLDDIEEIEYETREGFDDDAALTLVTRYAKTVEPGIEMSRLIVDEQETPSIHLLDQADPDSALPAWHRVSTLDAPDEVWLTLMLNEGLIIQDQPTDEVMVPFRIRVREKGTVPWINLPEIHIGNVRPLPFQRIVRLKWGTAVGVTPPGQKGFVAALTTVPVQTASPTGLGGWTADGAYFSSGDTWLISTNTGTTGVENIDLYEDYCDIWLDVADVPQGPLDIEIMRGQAIVRADLTIATYLYGGNVKDLFGYYFNSPVVEVRVSADSASLIASGLEAGDVVDGVTLIAGDRVLVSAAFGLGGGDVAYGIYVAQASGAAVRATDFDTDGEIRGAIVHISEGSLHAGKNVINTNGSAITVGVTSIAFAPYSGGVANFARAIEPQELVNDTVIVRRVATVFNSSPIPVAGKFAVIAVRAHNRSIQQLSVLASGYVPDWDGAAWSGNVVTSNPAPHFRDVLCGSLGADPLPEALVDDDGLVAWRTRCAAAGYEVNAVVEGQPADNVLDMIASCGYARKRQSEVWGVAEDRDLTGVAPVQVFSPRNSRNFRWEKAFAKRSDGLRVRFSDAEEEYREREIIVAHPDFVGDPVTTDDIRYEGLVTEDEVTLRALYDQRVTTARFTFYSLEADVEALVCTRGSLVGVQHDTFNPRAGFSRVSQVMRSGGQVFGLLLDGSVPSEEGLFDGADDFFIEPTDFFDEGAGTIGVAIRLKNGQVVIHEARLNDTLPDGHGRDVRFRYPFPDPGASVLDEDCLVTTGEMGSEFKRLIVLDMQLRDELSAQLTLIDEAPEIWSLFGEQGARLLIDTDDRLLIDSDSFVRI